MSLYCLLLTCCCGMPVGDGSVIFWQNGPLARPIQKHTGSTVSHVAVVLYEDDEPFVYEATWPKVRRMPLDDYYKYLAGTLSRKVSARRGLQCFAMQPREGYSLEQLDAMKQYARSQLGRRYMLRGWWKNREVRGIMCSQFVGNTIERSGRIRSANYKESPISLKNKIGTMYE